NGLAGDVVKWIDKLPAAELNSTPTAVAVADAYATTKNWSRLKRWTRTGAWGDSEYLRLGYQAIATRQSRPRTGNASDEFETLWRSAEQSANEQTEHELALARLASKWDFEKESEELRWCVANTASPRRVGPAGIRAVSRTEREA